jgi:Dolichyl-phosphate-mannose-protein mannosyltransferase
VSDETAGGSVARRAPRRFEPRGRRVTILDEADGQVAATPEQPSPAPARRRRLSPWGFALAQGAVAYVISRAMVLAAAGAVAAAQQPRPTSAKGPILNVLTSWDGLWYFEVVRHGYPTSVPPHITYFDPEARAAFFPLYPILVRAADRVLPGGEVMAGLFVNLVLGALAVLLVGLIARRLFDAEVAGRSMVLMALFPGSFVLSFSYSEALMLVLVAAALLLLLERRWLLAGLVSALATASRPNAIAIVAACAVAAWLAWRRERDWRAWVAPLLAPIGFVAFQLYLWAHTGELTVWARVQQDAWNEGASFGWTALRRTAEAFTSPFDSATNIITMLCVVATVIGIYVLFKARLPASVVAYTLVVIALMLLPATVTARPRFLYTAFPILIAGAAIWPKDEEKWWGLGLSLLGAGLVAVTALYGLYAAIP